MLFRSKLAFTPLGGAAQTIGNASGYNVTNAINITGGNGADTVAFAPQAAAAYRVPGNLSVNLGNGNDTITTKGDFAVNGSANMSVAAGPGGNPRRPSMFNALASAMVTTPK